MAGKSRAYWEKLKDPQWQKKRLEILQRDEFTCVDCGSKDQTLHVHHTYYRRGADPWDYPDESFKTLCEDCHEATTLVVSEIHQMIGALTRDQLYGLNSVLYCMLEFAGFPADKDTFGHEVDLCMSLEMLMACGYQFGMRKKEEGEE